MLSDQGGQLGDEPERRLEEKTNGYGRQLGKSNEKLAERAKHTTASIGEGH